MPTIGRKTDLPRASLAGAVDRLPKASGKQAKKTGAPSGHLVPADLPPGKIEVSAATLKGGAGAGGASMAARRTELESAVGEPTFNEGPKAAPREEVTRVLAHYGVDERLGRPRERVAQWAARIHDGFMAAGAGEKGTAEVADLLLKNDVRLDVFYLEGILKLYKDRYLAPCEAVFDKVKALEDALGQASGARSHLAMAEKQPGVPKEAIAWLKGEVERTSVALTALVEKEWTPDDGGRLPALAETVQFLETTAWDDYKDDKKYLQKELSGRLKKADKTELDMSVLQGDTGVHELRRVLRWFPIYAVALDGMIAFDDKAHPVKEYQALLENQELVNNKYAQLPPSVREKKPLDISRSLYLRNTELIYELGKLKDKGEEIEGIAHALLGAGLESDTAAAMTRAEGILGMPPDAEEAVFARAGEIYDEIRDHGFFKAFRDEVRGR